jgi:hypothetical protein
MRGMPARVLQIAALTFTLACVPYLALRSYAFDRDPDIWWHIRVGDWIAQHHALPRIGIYSQHIERPWIAYSWCFDLLVSGIQSIFGLPGIPGLLIFLEILISLTILLAIHRIAGRFWWSWLIATAAIVAAYFDPLRPALLTLLFFTLELLLIFEVERTGDDRRLWWMAPLFMFWANCHIQFVYGMAVLALYVGSRMRSLGKRSSHSAGPQTSALTLAGIFAAALAGSCIGPNAWLPYKVAFGYMGQFYMYQVVQEMSAMDFRRPEHFVLLMLLIAACYRLGQSKRRDPFRPALLVVTALVSFRSVRDMWFAAVACAFVIAEGVRDGFAAQSPGTDGEWSSSKWLLLGYAVAVPLALAHSFAYGIGHRITTPAIIGDVDRIYPIRATEFILDSHLPGPMYNSFNWGGFLIFNLRDYPVSIDPRTDLYGEALLRRAMATVQGVDWQRDPDLARANFVLIERYLPLADDLAKAPGYRLVYQDPLARVFVKQPRLSPPAP